MKYLEDIIMDNNLDALSIMILILLHTLVLSIIVSYGGVCLYVIFKNLLNKNN